MRIAQIAPLIESVPPRLYGGTERIVAYLTDELVRQGHEVTLFASGDLLTSAQLVSCASRALRLDPTVVDPLHHYMIMLDKVRRCAAEFDILHFHLDYLHFPLLHELARRTVTTAHGRQDLPDLRVVYGAFPQFPLISISDDQRRPLRDSYWLARSCMACLQTSTRSRRARPAAISPFWVGSVRKSGPTTPSRSRAVPASSSRSRPRSIASIRPISTP